jgi:poly(3-hydroxybutyrate) depolymerase
LIINALPDSLVAFKPETKSYDITIPQDCFGALLSIDYSPEFYISVRADQDAGRFGFPELDPDMGDYIAGTEIPFYEYYNGWILRFDKREACFDNDLDITVTIDCGSSEHGTDRYELHIHRPCARELRELFVERQFHDGEFDITMPYELYVPKKYNRRKKYPLVVALHGTGEIQEPTSAILKKTEMATVWAKDSENGHNECIVLVPHCTIRYDEDDNWTTLNQFAKGRTESPFWPMPQLKVVWKLMEQLRSEYNIDKDRLYLIGISSGAFGAYVFAEDHPDTFAGMIAACGAANPSRIEALKGLPMWIFHSDDDPVIVPSYTLEPTLHALDQAGIKYNLTRYPKGRIFWQSGHFCWEVLFKDEKLRDWLFAQRIGGTKKLKKALGIQAGDKKNGHDITEHTNTIAAKAIAAADLKDGM